MCGFVRVTRGCGSGRCTERGNTQTTQSNALDFNAERAGQKDKKGHNCWAHGASQFHRVLLIKNCIELLWLPSTHIHMLFALRRFVFCF